MSSHSRSTGGGTGRTRPSVGNRSKPVTTSSDPFTASYYCDDDNYTVIPNSAEEVIAGENTEPESIPGESSPEELEAFVLKKMEKASNGAGVNYVRLAEVVKALKLARRSHLLDKRLADMDAYRKQQLERDPNYPQ